MRPGGPGLAGGTRAGAGGEGEIGGHGHLHGGREALLPRHAAAARAAPAPPGGGGRGGGGGAGRGEGPHPNRQGQHGITVFLRRRLGLLVITLKKGGTLEKKPLQQGIKRIND